MTRQAIAPESLALLARRYPALGGLRRVRGNGLSVNSATCLFETERGLHFAKRYALCERDTAGIEGEHLIVLHLLERGYPTPALLADAEGRTLVWHDEAPHAVYAAAEGEDRYGDAPVFRPLSPTEAASAGRRLAELHLALRDLPPRAPRPFTGLVARYELMAGPDLAEGLSALGREAPALGSYMAANPGLGALMPWLEARRSAIAPLLPAMPRGVIHGDFIKRNMFWRGDEVVSVIDFDLWNVGPLAFDLALALLPAGFDWPAILDRGGAPDRAALAAMLAGYEAIRPLTPAERQGLPWLLETARLEFYLSAIHAALGRGAADEADRFHRLMLDTAGWFEAHPGASRSFFA